MEKKTLWTKNYTTIMVATALGALGNVALNFALSFLVFDETGSTLASAIMFAIQMVPGVIIPLLVSPVLDRYPRKPFLVFFDGLFSLMYLLAGIWLLIRPFNYIEYLIASLIFAAIGELDGMSFNALFPKLIPKGMEEKGFTISSLLYPIISVIMTPVVSVIYKKVGLANLLFFQAACSLAACLIESGIKVEETTVEGTRLSLRQWWGDIKDAVRYLRDEPGLFWQTLYSNYSNGTGTGYETMWIAFTSTTAGFSPRTYAFCEAALLLGRTVGGVLLVRKETPKEKKFMKTFRIYMAYDILDTIMLYLPYPLMLVNRGIAGYMGVQSGNIRYAAFQKYIPDSMRARLDAFDSVFFLIMNSALTLIIGALGEILPYRTVITIFGSISVLLCILIVWRHRSSIEAIYLKEYDDETKED
ncbi:MAG: MFS transporter [Oscillospiraceae bacterium]|nr:MFS transporter [Oscillospiraceae bacterium]